MGLAAFVSFAVMGLWEPAVQTFSLVFAAVTLSLAVGMPLGIVAGRSDRFLRVDHAGARRDADRPGVRLPDADRDPVLGRPGRGGHHDDDLLGSRGVRITALGIRGVPGNTVEAAAAMGSTRRQMLAKVQLPLARKMLLLSVNQTILFALSMVVIASLIDTDPGLGGLVTNGLNTNPALAILAGAAIVIMAISIDRSTEAMAERTDPVRAHVTDAKRRRLRLETVATAVAIGLSVGIAYALDAGSAYVNVGNAPAWLESSRSRACSTTSRTRRRSSSPSRAGSGTTSSRTCCSRC